MKILNHTSSNFNYAKGNDFYPIPANSIAEIDEESTGITAEDLIACYGTRISIIKEDVIEETPAETKEEENIEDSQHTNGEENDNTTETNNGTTSEGDNSSEESNQEDSLEDKDVPTVEDVVKDVIDSANKAVKAVKDATKSRRGRPKAAQKKKN